MLEPGPRGYGMSWCSAWPGVVLVSHPHGPPADPPAPSARIQSFCTARVPPGLLIPAAAWWRAWRHCGRRRPRHLSSRSRKRKHPLCGVHAMPSTHRRMRSVLRPAGTPYSDCFLRRLLLLRCRDPARRGKAVSRLWQRLASNRCMRSSRWHAACASCSSCCSKPTHTSSPCCERSAYRLRMRPPSAAALCLLNVTAKRAARKPAIGARRVHPPGRGGGCLARCTSGGAVEQAESGSGWGQQVQLVCPAVATGGEGVPRCGWAWSSQDRQLAQAACRCAIWLHASDQVPILATACSPPCHGRDGPLRLCRKSRH